MDIPEYWRFDPTGRFYRNVRLAGDTLVNGRYKPIPISQYGEENLWGHSPVLDLDLWWENGQLRFWDPVNRYYLATYDEVLAYTREIEAARAEAETRIRQLEAELRRRPNA